MLPDLLEAPPTAPPARPTSSLAYLRPVALVALLLAEIVGLTLRFDAEGLARINAWWARLLVSAHYLPQLVLVMAAATVLFSGTRLGREVRHLARTGRAWPAGPFLVAHLAVFMGFARLTAFVLEGDIGSSTWPEAWALAWMTLAGLTLALWAAAVLPANWWLPLLRRGLAPLLVGAAVGLLGWGAGRLTGQLWLPLSRSTFWLVHFLLSLVVANPVCDPEAAVIGTRTFWVRIAPECSGYEGVGLIWVFLAAYLWLYRRELRFPGALLLLPLATAVIWLLNAVRIAALIVLGTWGSPAVALGGFHSQAGWLTFNAVALGLVAASQRLRCFSSRPAERQPGDSTTALLAPLLALVATMMLTAAFSTGFDWAYPLRVVATGAVLWHFRRHYAGLFGRCSWAGPILGAAVFGLWLVLEPAPSAGASESFAAALGGAPAGLAGLWLVVRIAGSVVTVALAEELAFRGYLTRRLVAAEFEAVPLGRFTWFSFLASSALFGVLHGRWLAGTLAGMVFALALYRRGRLADAVVAHAVANGLIAGYVLTTGQWSLWL